MKLLCPACERLGEPSSLRVEAGCVLATCGRCGASGSVGALSPLPLDSLPPPPLAPVLSAPRVQALPVAAPQPAALAVDEDPYAVPAGRCPKCVAVRPEAALNCPHCGLTFTNFVADEHRLKPGLDRAWRLLLQKWEDPSMHDKLLQRAQAEEALPQVARLYQLRIARNDADAMARRGREELLKRAMATATVTARAEGTKPAVNRRALWLGLLGGTVLLLVLLMALLAAGRGAAG